MRVKKLNTNRRAKAGDDDAASTGSAGDSEPHTSSPTKWKDIDSPDPHNSSSSSRRVDAVEFGADSPTDPSAALPPHDVVVSELELNRQTAYAAASMANLIATAHATANAANGNATTTAIAATTATTSTTTSSSTESTTPASSSSWRDRVDATLRESVHTKIVEYLKTLKPNAPAKVMDKLPGLAFRMEDALFKVAASEQEYADQSTLPQRLTLIQQANAKRLLQQQWPVVSPKDKDASSRKPLNEAQARVVFSCLQSWRQKLVNMYSAVPWEILPNQILAKVAVFVPSTTQELVVCGVPNEQLERFGNSLLQEIEKILNALNANATAAAAQQLQAAMIQQAARSMSPSATKRPAPASGKGSSANKSSSATKKRKTGAESTATSNTNAPTPAVRLAAAPAATFLSAASFLSQAPSLIRPIDPAFIAAATSAAAAAAGTSSLPALLPSGPLPSAASGSAAARTASFFPRIPVPDQQSENRMHLLAQGVGQLSQQQEQQQNLERSVDAYEKEIQTLRWMLQESQREKALLEQEVLRLRQQGAK